MAMEKLRKRKDLLSVPAFRMKFKDKQNVLFDLIEDLYSQDTHLHEITAPQAPIDPQKTSTPPLFMGATSII